MMDAARNGRQLAYKLPENFGNILSYAEQGNAEVVCLLIEAAENKVDQLQAYLAQIRVEMKLQPGRVITMQHR